MTFEVLNGAEQTEPYVNSVQLAADENRDALGFLSKAAYWSAAQQGKLYVAVDMSSGRGRYAGHLMFGGTFPNGRIFQVNVLSKYRRKGIGRRLVLAVVNAAEKDGFLQIRADVASDLRTSNRFWEEQGFICAGQRKGRGRRQRTINLRVRELDTPGLFGRPFMGKRNLGPLLQSSSGSRQFVFDLNFLFDLIRGRRGRRAATSIVAAAFDNRIQLAIAEEFVSELERSSLLPSNDPLLELALQLPRLPRPSCKRLQELASEMAPIVFRERWINNCLTERDRSDLSHIATASIYRCAGFVTSEKAILRAREDIFGRYGLDIVGPDELAALVGPSVREGHQPLQVASQGNILDVRSARESDMLAVGKLLSDLGWSQDSIRESLDQSVWRDSLVARVNDRLVAVAHWTPSATSLGSIEARVSIDDAAPCAMLVADRIVESLCRSVASEGPKLITLKGGAEVPTLREAAYLLGFRDLDELRSGISPFQKVCGGEVVLPQAWQKFRTQVSRISSITLPKEFLASDVDETLPICSRDGRKTRASMFDLENLMSPVLYLFPARKAAIVPIRREFAEALFGTSSQMTLLAGREALLRREKVYLSHQRSTKVLTRGTIAFFYESGRNGGRSEVVAVARVVGTSLVPRSELGEVTVTHAVLDKSIVDTMYSSHSFLSSTKIDNVFLFSRPVSYSRLKEIGCVGGANLVTAQTIKSNHASLIVQEGRPHV